MFSNVIEVMVKVHVVDLKAETVAAPITVRAFLNQTVIEFKQLISKVSYIYIIKLDFEYFLNFAVYGSLVVSGCRFYYKGQYL